MTLRKTKIDNNVRYTSKDSHSHSKHAPGISKERSNKSKKRKKNASGKKLSQKNKNFFKNIKRNIL